MEEPNGRHSDLARLSQEAGVYEEHGLYDHALSIYRRILEQDPLNEQARKRLTALLAKPQGGVVGDAALEQPTELTPTQALDLGVAYIEMGQFADALPYLEQSAASPTSGRVQAMRHMALCLTRLRRYPEAQDVVRKLLDDRTLSAKERGLIVNDIADAFIRDGQVTGAAELLGKIPEEERSFVPDYPRFLEELAAARRGLEQFQVLVSDEETGEAYVTASLAQVEAFPFEAAKTQEAVPVPTEVEVGPPIRLETRVTYSLDSERWYEGVSVELASTWASLNVPRPVREGSSLMILIYLPTGPADEPLWVLTQVTDSIAAVHGESKIKVKFVSFPSGGRPTLMAFLDRARKDPFALRKAAEGQRISSEVRESLTVFSTLEAQTVASMETGLFPDARQEAIEEIEEIEEISEPASVTVVEAAPPPPPTEVLKTSQVDKAFEEVEDKAPLYIRFACECGQVHTVPRKSIGRKGTCAGCGQQTRVPYVSSRTDRVTDQLLGKTLGGCRILYKIGGGGMGGVFKARHLGLDIPVAVKVLYAHLADRDTVFVKRFIREARAAAKLQHPNIVGVMNVGFEEGFHYLIMQYLGGGSAAAILASIGRFPLEKVLDIAVQVSEALVHAQENNILHRDIKPANILFTEKGEAKLADLGLAKTFPDPPDSGITQTGITCGTPLYISPEQAKGDPNADIRSDIYSLGITLYHLLEGTPPFTGDSPYAVFQKHVYDELPPLKNPNPPLPDAVFEFLKKMTAKNPEDRFQSAQEVLEVAQALRDEIVTQPQPSTKKGILERLGLKRSS
jgi:serine/threonine-protein kinase